MVRTAAAVNLLSGAVRRCCRTSITLFVVAIVVSLQFRDPVDQLHAEGRRSVGVCYRVRFGMLVRLDA
jgi:hypothetical protein